MEQEKPNQLLDAIAQDDITKVRTWLDRNAPNHATNATKQVLF